MEVDLQTVLMVVGAICTPLLGAIVYLWKSLDTRQKSTETKLDECEQRHHEKDKQFTDLTVKVAAMDAKVEGYMEAREQVTDKMETVEQLTRKVLDKLGGAHEPGRNNGD